MTWVEDTDNEEPMASEDDNAESVTKADAAGVQEQQADGSHELALTGNWTTRSIAGIDGWMRKFSDRAPQQVVFDFGPMANIDTAGAFVIRRTVEQLRKAGKSVEFRNISTSEEVLLDAVADAAGQDLPEKPSSGFGLLTPFAATGRAVYATAEQMKDGFGILGSAIAGSSGHGISLTAIVAQIHRIGVGAIPVVLLMNAIIGAIVAQQGAFQLRYFGAEIFVVDLVSVLVLRETGALITAIMIAGRSGSAITAEIGSMKMREEVDALKVIGLNPIGVLVFPRLVALMIALPLLTVAADAAGLAGAMVIANYYSDISYTAFISRMEGWIDVTTVFAGLIKTPFMALAIGVIASMEGMRVGGSAESLGARVTASVVKSIFVVIVLDGLFAIFFASIGF
ncbi:ABC transporter permease [Notoacmeibacter sp. MSK16QG-6]|uniref:ABC transporter permease n=1 Tax=Notoacmeibacter sp. MSK16QG-6 TaxID=2957982 RepID=UPI0020A0DEA0|nr:ABC transporter permease [Notoacmeibacter sp. MSK16QG-6]MCP1197916.1 ABC transporter permease [Notoacmeibacter sp. MSK16QG-6]